MSLGRFNTPLALIRDRFIIACGGQVNESSATSQCEAYDIETNNWFSISSLQMPMSNTSAIVMNNRFIYLMPGPGLPDESPFLKPDCCSIEVLDTGSSI